MSAKRGAPWLFMRSQIVLSLIFKDPVAFCLHASNCWCCCTLSWTGMRWLNSSSKAGRSTYMQTRGRWEPKLLDVLLKKKQKKNVLHKCLIFVSVCYIVLHVLSSSTCRMKRSSWRTLRPRRRPASTFGSAVWRTRLSTSESTLFIDCSVFSAPSPSVHCRDLDTCFASLSNDWKVTATRCLGVLKSHFPQGCLSARKWGVSCSWPQVN